MSGDRTGISSLALAAGRHAGRPKQSVSGVLGVLWFLVGLSLAFGGVKSPTPERTRHAHARCGRCPLWDSS